MGSEEKRRKDRERKAAKRNPPKQRQKTGAGDIRKHRHTPEFERSVAKGKTRTTYWRCSVCHVDMGSTTEDL